MHVPAQELAWIVVPQEPGRCRVGEGAAALQVNPINRFGSGIKQEPYVLFTLAQGLLRCNSLGDLTGTFDPKGDLLRDCANRVNRPPVQRPGKS